MPIYLDMPANRTVEIKGTGQVLILMTGNKMKCVMVVLLGTMLSDGDEDRDVRESDLKYIELT